LLASSLWCYARDAGVSAALAGRFAPARCPVPSPLTFPLHPAPPIILTLSPRLLSELQTERRHPAPLVTGRSSWYRAVLNAAQ